MRLVLAVGVLVLAAGGCCGDLFDRISKASEGTPEVETAWGLTVEQPRGPMTLTGSEPTFGPAGARFTLVEFVDFQCPHCARMAPVLHEFAAQNQDVRLVFRNYPLSAECNPHISIAMHEHACAATVAAGCAGKQGRFWEMTASLFDHYTALEPENVTSYAAELGLSADSFAGCLATTNAGELVLSDVDAAAALQLEGTPTLYLHGAYGADWVLLNMGPGDVEQLGALLVSARKGETLPPPAPPAPLQ